MGESVQEPQTERSDTSEIRRSGYLKYIFLVILLVISLKVAAPGSPVAFIFVSEPVNAYNRLINAIVMVESSGNPFAVNIEEEAFGAFQIRPIRLLDYYQRTGKKYTTEDCFSYNISKEIFIYYARLIGYPDYQTIACNWNGSGRMTLVYWEKIKKFL